MEIEGISNSSTVRAATYGTFSSLWAFVLGFLMGIFGTLAGLIIYGLARDQEQQSFGWFVIIGSIIPLLGTLLFVLLFIGSITGGLASMTLQ